MTLPASGWASGAIGIARTGDMRAKPTPAMKAVAISFVMMASPGLMDLLTGSKRLCQQDEIIIPIVGESVRSFGSTSGGFFTMLRSFCTALVPLTGPRVACCRAAYTVILVHGGRVVTADRSAAAA